MLQIKEQCLQDAVDIWAFYEEALLSDHTAFESVQY